MPIEITNKKRSVSVIRVEGISANTVYLANLSAGADETVTAATIKRILWSTGGTVNITRNSNSICTLYGSGEMRFDDFAFSLQSNNASSMVITITTGGSFVMEVSKQTSYNVDPYTGVSITWN